MSDIFTTPPQLIQCINQWFHAQDAVRVLRTRASQQRENGERSYTVNYVVAIPPRYSRVLGEFTNEQVRAVIENEISNVADFNEQLNVIRYVEPSHIVGKLELSLHVREPYYGWTY